MDSSRAISEMVLKTLRLLGHELDLRSRQLIKTVGLSVPQLLVLKEVTENEEITIGHVARNVSLRQATVTAIVDRLESRNLIVRRRDGIDRRKVYISATEEGAAILDSNPYILQEEFTKAFGELAEWEQLQILSSLQRVATMLCADHTAEFPPLENGEPGEKKTNRDLDPR